MGQGSETGLAMILADELEADWAKVRLGPVPETPAGWSRRVSTGGSTAIRTSWDPLRKAGATARELLISAAAATWDVDRAACRAEQGAVIHTPTKRRLTYGKLAARAAKLPVPTEVPLKDPKDFRLLGTRTPRLDTPVKVDGSAVFGIDVKVPGMLIASIERCPVFGGTQKRRCGRRARGGGEAGGSGVRGAVPASRDDGADELHGARARRRLRCLGAHAESDAGAGSGGGAHRPAEREGDRPHHLPGRRVRAPARAGLRLGGGAGIQGRERPGESDLVARGRRAARVLSPGNVQQVRGGSRCRGHPGGLDAPHRGAAHPPQVRAARQGHRPDV